MKIETNKVVTVHYTLFNDKNEMMESSHDSQPLTFMQGSGMLIKGFETAVEGKSENDRLSFNVQPEDGYGEFNDELVFELPKERLAEIQGLEVGMGLRMETPNGAMIVRVAGIDDQKVSLDGNHPLAGVPLRFDVEVLEVRDATREELDEQARRAAEAACSGSCSDSCCSSCGGGCEE
ncbi:MAG TPA: peptidylprolyl isomerase [Deltaproteobacteria bacterium]|nr:peptidylprolyl isomerase [Deltaproteobacteria bacterium]